MGKQVISKRSFAKRKLKPGRSIRRKRPQTLSEAAQREAKSGPRQPPAQPNPEKIISTLPLRSLERLRGIWKNCLIKLASNEDGHWRDSAIEVLFAVETEWDRRSRVARSDEFFNWPSTEAIGGNGKLMLPQSVSDGMLSYLDYRVGRQNGEVASIRQSILCRVFEGHLPPVFTTDYMSSWGVPKSAARLRKIAESIAAFTRNAKRRRDYEMDDAISDWESDLGFLYERYYVGHFSFGWPITGI
jgi:hypothetical protein